MAREILPNVAAPLIVYTTLIIPANILFEAGLSFLGVGVPDTVPSWGGMLSDVRHRLHVRAVAHDLPGSRAVHDDPRVQPRGRRTCETHSILGPRASDRIQG